MSALDLDSELEELAAQARFTGYAYALTDVSSALRAYVQSSETIVITIQDVLDITTRLIGEAQVGGNKLAARPG